MSIQEYRDFIASRAIKHQASGFSPASINGNAKRHQENVIRFALERGKSAAFLDTGLGKSFIELEFARQCAEETGKPSLILTPLAVAGQMVREGQKFGIDVTYARHSVDERITITNYEMLEHFNPADYTGIVLDESSILKSYDGKFRNQIIDSFKSTPFNHAELAVQASLNGVDLNESII